MKKERYHVIDAIRGLAALVVAIDHGVFFSDLPTVYGEKLIQATKVLCNGPSAVLIFFVVSGFCIHLGFDRSEFQSGRFLKKRLTRILVPLVAASLIAYAVGFRWFHAGFGETVVWSLYCEIIYYVFYAVFAKRITLKGLVKTSVVGLVLALVFAYLGRGIIEYPRRDVWAVALMGAPIWLSGVILAELRHKSFKIPKLLNIALWICLLAGGAVTTAFKFKFGLSYGISLTLYGLIIAPWLLFNLRLNTYRWLGSFGAISYSLYLIHQPMLSFFKKKLGFMESPIFIEDSILILGILGFSTLFYFLVEKPSHRLARKL